MKAEMKVREVGAEMSFRLARARQALSILVEETPERREALRQELFAEDFRVEVPARGGCPVYAALDSGEFRDGVVEVVEMVESGNRVLSHVRLDIRRRHDVQGTPTEQRCHADGIVTFEFAGERIGRTWSVLQWR